jgi:hypothetical protein
MTRADDTLLDLFRDYAAASRGHEPERVAGFYAESFIAAGPRGSAVFKNDDQFHEWLRQVEQFNQSTGMTSMTVVSVQEPLSLSEKHVLVTVDWGARFVKTGDRLITFQIAYLLERSSAGWKILAYVSQKDQEEEMRGLGLIQ